MNYQSMMPDIPMPSNTLSFATPAKTGGNATPSLNLGALALNRNLHLNSNTQHQTYGSSLYSKPAGAPVNVTGAKKQLSSTSGLGGYSESAQNNTTLASNIIGAGGPASQLSIGGAIGHGNQYTTREDGSRYNQDSGFMLPSILTNVNSGGINVGGGGGGASSSMR